MNGEGSGFYNVPQAARILRTTLERVLELIREGHLKANRCEQAGDWLIEARSVHACLTAASSPEPQELEVKPKTTTSLLSQGAQEETGIGHGRRGAWRDGERLPPGGHRAAPRASSVRP